MSELRKRMIECLQLRGLAEPHAGSIGAGSAATGRTLSQVTGPDIEEELRQYFLFLKNHKHYSRHTMTVAICGLKCFFEHTLRQEWTTFNIVRPASVVFWCSETE